MMRPAPKTHGNYLPRQLVFFSYGSGFPAAIVSRYLGHRTSRLESRSHKKQTFLPIQ
jgi:hypothetical protein